MTHEDLAPNLLLLTDSVAPQSDPAMLRDLTANHGVSSFLAVGGFPESPLFRVPDGPWSLVFSLVDPAHPSAYERQVIRDFVGYERGQGRKVALWVEMDDLRASVVEDAVAATDMPAREEREAMPGGKARCFSGHQSGVCGGGLVGHATPASSAQAILDAGALFSKSTLLGKPSEDLARESAYGEPGEYFDYVMFWNGDCMGSELVARVRSIGRETPAGLTPQDLDRVAPGVRFFFDPSVLVSRPNAAWDGAHAIKIKDRLDLDPYLVAVVAPSYADGVEFKLCMPTSMSDRVAYVDPTPVVEMSAWTTAASKAAVGIQARPRKPEAP